MYVCMYVCMYACVYIYIYRERERYIHGGPTTHVGPWTLLCVPGLPAVAQERNGLWSSRRGWGVKMPCAISWCSGIGRAGHRSTAEPEPWTCVCPGISEDNRIRGEALSRPGAPLRTQSKARSRCARSFLPRTERTDCGSLFEAIVWGREKSTNFDQSPATLEEAICQ